MRMISEGCGAPRRLPSPPRIPHRRHLPLQPHSRLSLEAGPGWAGLGRAGPGKAGQSREGGSPSSPPPRPPEAGQERTPQRYSREEGLASHPGMITAVY